MTKKQINPIFAKTYFTDKLFNMHFHFTDSKEEFVNMLEWINVHDTPEYIDGRCVLAERICEPMRIFIGVFNDDLGTLAHECTHAALFTLSCIGQKLTYEDELLPYLVGYIFEECQNKAKK